MPNMTEKKAAAANSSSDLNETDTQSQSQPVLYKNNNVSCDIPFKDSSKTKCQKPNCDIKINLEDSCYGEPSLQNVAKQKTGTEKNSVTLSGDRELSVPLGAVSDSVSGPWTGGYADDGMFVSSCSESEEESDWNDDECDAEVQRIVNLSNDIMSQPPTPKPTLDEPSLNDYEEEVFSAECPLLSTSDDCHLHNPIDLTLKPATHSLLSPFKLVEPSYLDGEGIVEVIGGNRELSSQGECVGDSLLKPRRRLSRSGQLGTASKSPDMSPVTTEYKTE